MTPAIGHSSIDLLRHAVAEGPVFLSHLHEAHQDVLGPHPELLPEALGQGPVERLLDLHRPVRAASAARGQASTTPRCIVPPGERDPELGSQQGTA
jgi:hypothetical protein